MFNLEYVKRNCCLCYDCVRLCPAGAISKTEDGLLAWDKNECHGCESCTDVCINNALYGVWK